MNLAEHQHALLSLIAVDPPAALADARKDGYIASVEGSMPLEVVREIADSWRRFSLSRSCPLTWRLLQQRNHLAGALDQMSRRRGLSPFLQILACQFLDQVAAGDDLLDAAVARFERMLVDGPLAETVLTSGGEVIVDWPCDPEPVLTRLVDDEPIGPRRPGHFRTRAMASDPTSFTVERLPGFLLATV